MTNYKLQIVLPFILLGVFMTSACTKQRGDESLLQAQPPFKYRIEAQTLVFPDVSEYSKAIDFISKADVKTLMEWQTEIGFSSIRSCYEKAREEYCCPDESTDWDEFQKKYGNTVRVNREDFDYSPLVNTPYSNWLLNQDRYYRIAETTIYYDQDSMFCTKTASGDDSREHYVTIPKIGKQQILDAHPYGPSKLSSTIDIVERDCSTNGPGTAPYAYISSPVESGNKRIKEAEHGIYDESKVIYTSLGTALVVEFSHKVFAHHQRKTWFGWTVCERTNWDIKASYNLTHNLPAVLAPINPIVANIDWQNTPSECKYNYVNSVLLASPLSGQNYNPLTVYYNRRLTGTVSFTYKAKGSGIIAEAGCQ